MESIPRNTPALLARIDQLRNSLIKRFENLIELANVEKTDRHTTALHEYQTQIETTGLIRASEDVLSLIRQMQEMWLFGQLNTLQSSGAQEKVDAQAAEVAALVKKFTDLQNATKPVTMS